MKTIEEKAKAYDEAIEIARQYYNDRAMPIGTNFKLERMFPELKESDDEKTRKEIIDFLELPHLQFVGKRDHEKWIAWLEKQGKSIKIKKGKNYLCTKTHKYAGVKWREGIKYYSPEDYSLVNQGCTCYCPKYSKEEHNNFFKEVEYDGCLEERGKQKPADKVEPKFKMGDWVVYDHRTYQIVELPQGRLINASLLRNGKTEKVPLPYCEKWSIQDAKDGDVLSYENEIFIVKKSVNINILYYCCYDREHFIIDSFYSLTIDDIDNIRPATKEQRDTLLKAMTDTGYTFDFEKKELKKIELKFKVGDRVRYKEHACDGIITEITNTDYICGNAKLPISTQDKLELVEQKSAWSEEDERNIKELLYLVESNYLSSEEPHDRLINFLESFKPQKQNITNKDLEGIIREIKIRIAQCNGFNRKHREEVFNLLDSLISQNTWKPSEEQIAAVKEAACYSSVFSEKTIDILFSLISDLKKLK